MTVFVDQSKFLTGTTGALITALDGFLVTTCGWTKPYSGTNSAVYKQPAASNGFYLRVDDSDPQYAHIRGYENMTDVDTGTNPFPTQTQFGLPGASPLGLWVTKSNAASSAQRPVVMLSNQKMFYMFHSTSQTNWDPVGGQFENWMFGDIITDKPGPDAFQTIIVGGMSQGSPLAGSLLTSAITVNGTSGHYLARSHSQLGSSIQSGKYSDYARAAGSGYIGGGGTLYPSQVTGNLNLSPVWVIDAPAVDTRGTLPGLWNPLHLKPLTHGDQQAGSGSLAGKTFLFVNIYQGQAALEISNTW